MTGTPPTAIAIDPDDYPAKYVGHTSDGRQVFLTTPFVPESHLGAGNTFVALVLFDQAGEKSGRSYYALRDRPEDPEISRLLGQVEEEFCHRRSAIRHYERYMEWASNRDRRLLSRIYRLREQAKNVESLSIPDYQLQELGVEEPTHSSR